VRANRMYAKTGIVCTRGGQLVWFVPIRRPKTINWRSPRRHRRRKGQVS
jgi:hypothetical protein